MTFLLCLSVYLAVVCFAGAEQASAAKLQGEVVSGKYLSAQPLSSTSVILYRAGSSKTTPRVLGKSLTNVKGKFTLTYKVPKRSKAVLYLLVGQKGSVRLASVLGVRPFPANIVVNERTTVAAGYSLAQFINGKGIAGSSPGLQNAASMVKNFVNTRTGRLSPVLKRNPNGNETSTLKTFNSLTNMLLRCARSNQRCSELFRLATPPGESAPHGALEAIGDIARNPAHRVRRLFKLAQSGPTPYRPALKKGQRPDAWTLALRFNGDGKSIDGPGNVAIDREGDLWVSNNYIYGPDPNEPRCAGNLLMRFDPRGRFVDGSPYTGGGLSGVGFGVTFAPNGNVWVGNYGFAGKGCTEEPPTTTVSEFTHKGEPLSPEGGYNEGSISKPQGVVSDRNGNIWIASCGNDTVAQYVDGDPAQARSFDLGANFGPFDLVVNKKGQAFVTGNGNNTVAMLNADGSSTSVSPISGGGINRPLGMAIDSRGNVWISNSGAVPLPCKEPGSFIPEPPYNPVGSATLIRSKGVLAPDSPFTGGGIKIPWGIAVDGNDNVWIANFDGQSLSQLCGTRTKYCPPDTETGDPITPNSGYGFDGLGRNTGVAVDPSGNVWVLNNWLEVPIQENPGGHEVIAFVGAAAPLKTPLIGPPRH